MPKRILFYCTCWCPDCLRARRILERLRIPFEYIDIDEIPGADLDMRAVNGGLTKVPTIVIDGTVLVEPTDRELRQALSGFKPRLRSSPA